MRVDVQLARADQDAWVLTAAFEDAEGNTVELGPHPVARIEEPPWVAPIAGPTGEGIDLLRDVVERIRDQSDVAENDGKRLGRYLYDSVIGLVWPPIREAAEDGGARLVELALHFPDDPALHGIPWELAHDSQTFLTAGAGVAVAMTRRVDATVKLEQFDAPARVLFAIGTDLLDQEVRSGAEFMGLMRELERRGDSIVPMIIDEASVERLHTAVERFKPDVVHLIGHGQADQTSAQLLMRAPPDSDDDEVPVDADTLFSALRRPGGLPKVVVLSACEGGAARVSHSVPLALELVGMGIPAVIAMSGRVSDPACRLFTRRFGSVLVSGEPLVQASADGRWAAFHEGEPPSWSVDWALPTLFVADNVEHEHRPMRTGAPPRLKERMRNFGFPEQPIFCGRRKFLRAYDDLFSDEFPLATLVIYTEGEQKGLGKTRLLKEFQAQALRDGHIPCRLPIRGAPSGERPSSLYDLAEQLLYGISEVRMRCGLPAVTTSKLLELLGGERPDLSQYPADERKYELEALVARYRMSAAERGIDAAMVKSAAAFDFERLRLAAVESDDATFGVHTRVLVTLDGVGRWDTLPEDLFGRILVGPEGFGMTAERHVPVVATCLREVLHGELLAELDETTRKRNDLRLMRLEPLQAGDEDTLAFQWVLLNPDPEVSKKVYAAPARGEPGDWYTPFRVVTQNGLPLYLGKKAFFDMAAWMESHGQLDAAEDFDRLKLVEPTVHEVGEGGL